MLLLARSGASADVITLSQAAGDGLWLPETTDVVQLGISAGDSVPYELAPVDDPARRPEELVERVYRDLTTLPPSDFWETLGALVYGDPDADEFPEDVALAEPEFLMDLLYRRYGEPIAVTWNFPLVPEGLTLPAARDRAAALQSLQDEVYDRSSDLHTALSDLSYREAFGRARAHRRCSRLRSERRSGRRRKSRRPSGDKSCSAAPPRGRRPSRRRCLWCKGVVVRSCSVLLRVAGTGWFATHAIALAVGPMLLGCIAGWVLTVWLVRSLGPSPLIEPADAWVALGWTLCAFLACGLSAVLGVRALTRPSLRRNRLAAVPWSLLALVLAGAAFLQLARDNAFFVTDGSQPPVTNVLTLAFTPLAVAALVGLAMRLAKTLLPRLRRVPSSAGLPCGSWHGAWPRRPRLRCCWCA